MLPNASQQYALAILGLVLLFLPFSTAKAQQAILQNEWKLGFEQWPGQKPQSWTVIEPAEGTVGFSFEPDSTAPSEGRYALLMNGPDLPDSLIGQNQCPGLFTIIPLPPGERYRVDWKFRNDQALFLVGIGSISSPEEAVPIVLQDDNPQVEWREITHFPTLPKDRSLLKIEFRTCSKGRFLVDDIFLKQIPTH